ncbi:MAG: chloride channel protein [Oscillospiraceae bacterium]|nr:chloride channel protein [Oscillospiraceae bacterium]
MDTGDNMSFKNQMLFMLFSFILGSFAGAVIWLFLKVVAVGINFWWEFIPSYFTFAYYPFVICIVGGVIIGVWRRIAGDYPENLEEVISVVKKTKRYAPRKTHTLFISAALPLMFGGSIGPEAGLSGVVASLCTWVGDRFKYMNKKFKELAEVGVPATLSILFNAPLFGIMSHLENEDGEDSFPGKTKIMIYFSSILGGIGVLFVLSSLLGGGLHIEKFEAASSGHFERIMFLPLALLGVAGGLAYHLFDNLARIIMKPLERLPIISSVIGGVALGFCAMFTPLLIFSGEEAITEIMSSFAAAMPFTLLMGGLVKLIITSICINTGWRGGHIIPVIFSGICMGKGMALLSGADPVFATIAVTAALCGSIMKKPLAVIVILLIFFPVNNIVLLSAAAFIGCFISPKKKEAEKAENKELELAK